MITIEKVCKNLGCVNKAKKPNHNYCDPCIMAKHRYGITIPERDEMLKSQGGKCVICGVNISFDGTPGSKRNTANMDHCHGSGKVRSILCWYCNTAIGKFDDNPDVVKKAAEYLILWQSLLKHG